jgi:mRNA interferase HicA
LREGGRHSWWSDPQFNKRSAVPRHNEINDPLAKKICKTWGSILLNPLIIGEPHEGGAAPVAALLQTHLRLA